MRAVHTAPQVLHHGDVDGKGVEGSDFDIELGRLAPVVCLRLFRFPVEGNRSVMLGPPSAVVERELDRLDTLLGEPETTGLRGGLRKHDGDDTLAAEPRIVNELVAVRALSQSLLHLAFRQRPGDFVLDAERLNAFGAAGARRAAETECDGGEQCECLPTRPLGECFVHPAFRDQWIPG